MKSVTKGAIHIHSTHSDGTESIKQIAKTAKKAGLDWIIITDHNSLDGLNEEGWYDGVAVLTGKEISPETGNHYLALDIQEEIPETLPPEFFIEEVNRQGGFGFIAHPDETKARRNSYPPLRWSDWEVTGFQGLEIWNYMSDWVDKYQPENAFRQYLSRHHLLTGPTKNVLNWWDDLNNKNGEIIPAIGGSDAHAFRFYFLKVFPYLDAFRTITNYIYLEKNLSSDFEEAKKQIYTAIRSGKNLIVNRIWNKNSDSISFYIENNGQLAFAGDKTNIDEKNILSVKLPAKGEIRIILNGELIRSVCTHDFETGDLKAGKYRIEVFYKGKPWVFSNPIMIADKN